MGCEGQCARTQLTAAPIPRTGADLGLAAAFGAALASLGVTTAPATRGDARAPLTGALAGGLGFLPLALTFLPLACRGKVHM